MIDELAEMEMIEIRRLALEHEKERLEKQIKEIKLNQKGFNGKPTLEEYFKD